MAGIDRELLRFGASAESEPRECVAHIARERAPITGVSQAQLAHRVFAPASDGFVIEEGAAVRVPERDRECPSA